MSLLLVLAGLALLLPFPSAYGHLWRIDHSLVIIAAVLMALSVLGMRFQMVRGLARFIAVFSMVFALLVFMRMWGVSYQMRWLYRVHAVAPQSCREGGPVGPRHDEAVERRAFELAGLPLEEGDFLSIECTEDGAEVSTLVLLDKGWTLTPDGELQG
ncbi:hypothetical protein OV208_24915 [Corallococcus sp. bb12-1]|uniref:hypothetical protein n=1 Tax=Corallococcus sp. bb12-1 TaxID=2996784 RepID=UPI00226E49A1|nr:hypothetical protein [Corallococcus sp. bb12-1]MCY1044582.1 hypothetical protein [Corallococcus sp. bb12-1]